LPGVRARGLAGTLVAVALLGPVPAEAVRWPWEKHEPWPRSSNLAVRTLAHPTVEAALGLGTTPSGTTDGYRFVAFGDQRALADGEWQQLLERIVRFEREKGEIAFLLDTGDIVDDGRYSDQFHFLEREILASVRHLPYLVGVGNHELKNNRDPAARRNTARFLAYLDPDLSPDRLYYRKDIGPATFLFLDTNDFVYGEDGERKSCPLEVDATTREGRQLLWLRPQLAELRAREPRLVIAVMHHPIVQSSGKHQTTACSLWNFQDDGRPLVDILADGGVDVILTGHTHTYERYRMVRDDGREIDVVNISGRPRDAVLWFGAGSRRAHHIGGIEHEWFDDLGWLGLDHWEIHQEEVMLRPEEANQFAIFTVEPNGDLRLQVHFLDEDWPGGSRTRREVLLYSERADLPSPE
jgi:hypothetical protein